MQLIDAHTHVQPTSIETAEFLGRLPYECDRAGDLDALLAQMDVAAVARSMIVPWLAAQDLVDEAVADGADRDDAVAAIVLRWQELNAWAAGAVRAHPDRLLCVVGVDPVLMGADGVKAEITRRLAEGAIGVKVAPLSLRMRPDDERMEVVWRAAREHGVFVLSQCGGNPALGPAWGAPRNFATVLESYPDLPVQLAHLGRHGEDDLAALMRRHDNVYSDTAMRLDRTMQPDWTPQGIVDVMRDVGPDRVMFATNFPIVDQAEYAATFRALPLTYEERQAIGYGNSARLYGLAP